MSDVMPNMSFNQDYSNLFSTSGINPGMSFNQDFSSIGNVQSQQMLAGIPLNDNYMTMLGNGEIQSKELQSFLKPQGYQAMSYEPVILPSDNIVSPYDLKTQYGIQQQGGVIKTNASDVNGVVVDPRFTGYNIIDGQKVPTGTNQQVGNPYQLTDAKGNVINYNFGGKTDPSTLDYFNAGVGTIGAIANFGLANRNAKATRAQNARDNARNDNMMNMYIDRQAGISAINWGAGWSVDKNGKPVYDASKGQTQAQYDAAKAAKAKALKDM